MTIRQLSVFVENRTGRINEVARILGDNKINMCAFSLAETAEFGILRMIVSDVELAQRVLKEAHFGISVNEVVALSLTNTPGAMAAVLDHLAKETIFIEYMYAFSQGERANVVIRPTDIERCVEVLNHHGVELIDEQGLFPRS